VRGSERKENLNITLKDISGYGNKDSTFYKQYDSDK